MNTMNILLADHHEITREGYITVLSRAIPEVKFTQATNYNEAKNACEQGSWNLVIMEVSIPGGNIMSLLSDIRQHDNPPPVLVSSSHDETKYGLMSIQNGASGYISKASSVDDFIKSVYAVLEGRSYVSQSLARNLIRQVRPGSQSSHHEILSERESEVMLKLAGGMTIKEVATEMNLSSKTISTYRARLMQKLNLKSLAEVVRYCLNHGLIKGRP
jgi:two-component system, NarL family, invasion response regulator UvrY